MKIYAYRVAQRGPRQLEEVLRRLSLVPFGQRLFDGAASGMRLEALDTKGDYVFADFTSRRSGHGPGKLSPEAEIADIELAEGDYFGEDTGIVYHPASRYLVVQYNHHGPKLPRISDYLYAADLSFGGLTTPAPGEVAGDYCGFRMGAVLRGDASARLAQMAIVKTFEFEISVPGIRAHDRSEGMSLMDAVTAPLPDGVDTVRVTIQTSKEQGGRLGRDGVMGFINEIRGLGGAVRGAFVRGKQAENTLTENVDLVEERLVAEALVNTGKGLRYSREDRWSALHRRIVAWLESDELPRTQ